MTLPEAERWMDRLADPGAYGWRPELRKCVSHVNRVTRQRFQRHHTPRGQPWQKRQPERERPKIGDIAPIMIDMRPGSVRFRKMIVREIRTQAERSLVERRWREKGYLRGGQALYRTSGKRPVRRLRDKMTQKSAPGHVQRVSSRRAVVGTHDRGAARLQAGDPADNVPPRVFYGLGPDDVAYFEQVFMDGFLKRVDKGMT